MTTSSIPPRKATLGAEIVTDLPLVLTVKEAAEVLRCSSRTIYNLIDRNQLKPFYVGRLVRFERAEILRFIRNQEEPL